MFRKVTPSVDDATSRPEPCDAYPPPECIVARKTSAGIFPSFSGRGVRMATKRSGDCGGISLEPASSGPVAPSKDGLPNPCVTTNALLPRLARFKKSRLEFFILVLPGIDFLALRNLKAYAHFRPTCGFGIAAKLMKKFRSLRWGCTKYLNRTTSTLHLAPSHLKAFIAARSVFIFFNAALPEFR